MVSSFRFLGRVADFLNMQSSKSSQNCGRYRKRKGSYCNYVNHHLGWTYAARNHDCTKSRSVGPSSDTPRLEAAQKGFKYDAASVEYHPAWRSPPAVGEERPMIFHDSKGRPCVQYVTRLSCSIFVLGSFWTWGFFSSPREAQKVVVRCHWRMTMSLWVFKVGKGKDNNIHGFPYPFDYCLYHMMISISMIYLYICVYIYRYIHALHCHIFI